jgi:hypothetical protein
VLFVEFPITGDLRLLLLVMEWIFVITGFEISSIFLLRFFKQEKTLKNIQDLGYFSLFAGFSLMWLFYIIGDYYASATTETPFLIWDVGSERALFLNIGYFTMIIAAFFLLLGIEKYNVILLKKYLFTGLFSICAILFLILFFIDIRITQPITYIFWMGFLSFFISYIIKFIKKLQSKGLYLFFGLAFMLIGFLFTTDAVVSVFGLQGRLIGAIMQLISVVLLSYFFLTLPPFSEFDWEEKLEALFLINNAGICLYYKVFVERKDMMSEHLISAAIASINIMLRELSETAVQRHGFSIIKKQTENVIIYQGDYVSGVLYTSEELNLPKLALRDFIEKFETLYKNILVDWDGLTDIFKPAEIIANDLFKS